MSTRIEQSFVDAVTDTAFYFMLSSLMALILIAAVLWKVNILGLILGVIFYIVYAGLTIFSARDIAIKYIKLLNHRTRFNSLRWR